MSVSYQAIMLEKVETAITSLKEKINCQREYEMSLTSFQTLKANGIHPVLGISDKEAYLKGVESPHFSESFLKIVFGKYPNLPLKGVQKLHARSIAHNLALGHITQEEWGPTPPDWEKVTALITTLEEQHLPENNSYLIGLEKEVDTLCEMAGMTAFYKLSLE